MTTRIQRSRKRGSRLPLGAVCVTRPGPWGNPFLPVIGCDPHQFCVDAFRWHLMFDDEGKAIAERAAIELRGKKLACWCPLNRSCHADVLIDAAEGLLWRDWRLDGSWFIRIRHSAEGYSATVFSAPKRLNPFSGKSELEKRITEIRWPNNKILPRSLDTGETACGFYASEQEAIDATFMMIDLRDEKKQCTWRDVEQARKELRRQAREKAKAQA